MRYLKQFFWIIVFSFLGEGLYALIPLPIPASIYGLLLIFFALQIGVLKLEQVKEGADFLIGIMPVLFIPAAVGLIDYWEIVKPIWFLVLVIIIVTTIFVLVVSGRITQWVIRRENKEKGRV